MQGTKTVVWTVGQAAIDGVLIAVLAIGLGAAVVWGVFREFYFSRTVNRISDGIQELPPTLGKLEESVRRLSVEMERAGKDGDSRMRFLSERLGESMRLIIDVENRVSGLIRDFRSQSGSNNYFHQSTSDNNQTNQGGDVKGDQR